MAASLLVVLGVACQPSAAEDRASERQAIRDGVPADSCGWPNVVWIGNCSGVLVAPDLVLFAGHCGANVSEIAMGESSSAPQRRLGVKRCETHPDWAFGNGLDLAYCLLDTAVRDVPIVPLAAGCELAALAPGKVVEMVGFGADVSDSPGTKRQGAATIVSYERELTVASPSVRICHGDSGGPAFAHVAMEGASGDLRIVGIASSTEWMDVCEPGNSYFSVPGAHLDWLESSSGRDLSPCFSALGEWSPGPLCSNAPDGVSLGGGTWNGGCGGAGTPTPSETCGVGFGPVPRDVDAPAVRLEISSTYPPIAAAFAEDGDGTGVREIRLVASALRTAAPEKLVERDEVPPYDFSLTGFADGVYVLDAVATDYAGNEASATLRVRVADGALVEDGAMAPSEGCTMAGRRGSEPESYGALVGLVAMVLAYRRSAKASNRRASGR